MQTEQPLVRGDHRPRDHRLTAGLVMLAATAMELGVIVFLLPMLNYWAFSGSLEMDLMIACYVVAWLITAASFILALLVLGSTVNATAERCLLHWVDLWMARLAPPPEPIGVVTIVFSSRGGDAVFLGPDDEPTVG